MALPADVSTFSLTFGHATNGYTDATGAVAMVGVKAKLFPVDLATGKRLNVLHVASGQEIVPKDITVTIDDSGKASVAPLPHTDNPGLSPIGFGYRVEWQVQSGSRRIAPDDKTFAVPAAVGSTVDFDLLDVAEAVPGVLVPIGEGPQGDKGDPGSQYPMVVHGDDQMVARPATSLPVVWFGTVDPLNADDTKDITIPLGDDAGQFTIAVSDPAVAALVADAGSGTAAALRAAYVAAVEELAAPKAAAGVSVKEHGAVGDGTTDDAAAIQAALAAAGPGGTVFFPPGVYAVESTINITQNNIKLRGTSRALGACQIVAKSALASVLAFNCYYPEMSDLSVNGADIATVGILLNRAANGEFARVQVHDAVSHGWKADIAGAGNNDLMKLWNCYAEHNGGDGFSTPAYQSDNNAIAFYDCEFSSNAGNGLRIAGAQNKVYGGQMTGNTGHGIMFGNSGDPATSTRDNILYAPYVEANTAGGIGAAAAGVVGANLLIGNITQGVDTAVMHGIITLGFDTASASGRMSILNGLGVGFIYDGLNLIATGPDAHYNVNVYAKGIGKVLSRGGGGFAETFTTTTTPAAGGAGALPATPAGYVELEINGVNRKLPYY